MVLCLGNVPVCATIISEESIQIGPHVDSVIFKVIDGLDERVSAIRSGLIEFDTSLFDPVSDPAFLPLPYYPYLEELSADPNISISMMPRNGYGHLTMNCDRYPLNISAFRRAFALAFNKTRVRDEVMDGRVLEHDSLVPHGNPWSIENELEPHYYDAQTETGNLILDHLGFAVNSTTGYRNTPDGVEFEIRIGRATYGEVEWEITQISRDTFESLHVRARIVGIAASPTIWQQCDLFFYGTAFQDYDLDWLAYEYWSENAQGLNGTDPNKCNFRNESYDALRETLLHSISYEEVYETAAEMQRILHYNVPRLVVYQNLYHQVYRNDKFTSHVIDVSQCISGQWTLRNIRSIDGGRGGTVTVGIAGEPNGFNIYLADHYARIILEEMSCSLYDRGPNGDPIPDLATNLLIECHADNPAVPDGHTRYTIDIIRNATWSDGNPLTAADVAFTFNYAVESGSYGNPAAEKLQGLVAAYAPTPQRVILEFDTESYWHFSRFAYTTIIPMHLLNEVHGIGYEEWASWNPILDVGDPNAWCGPFRFGEYLHGDYYELEGNPLYHYRVEESTTTDLDPTNGYLDTLVLSAVISGTSIAVIIIFANLSYKERKKAQSLF